MLAGNRGAGCGPAGPGGEGAGGAGRPKHGQLAACVGRKPDFGKLTAVCPGRAECSGGQGRMPGSSVASREPAGVGGPGEGGSRKGLEFST